MTLKLHLSKDQYEAYNLGAFHKGKNSNADAFYTKVSRAVEEMHIIGLINGLDLEGCVQLEHDSDLFA